MIFGQTFTAAVSESNAVVKISDRLRRMAIKSIDFGGAINFRQTEAVWRGGKRMQIFCGKRKRRRCSDVYGGDPTENLHKKAANTFTKRKSMV